MDEKIAESIKKVAFILEMEPEEYASQVLVKKHGWAAAPPGSDEDVILVKGSKQATIHDLLDVFERETGCYATAQHFLTGAREMDCSVVHSILYGGRPRIVHTVELSVDGIDVLVVEHRVSLDRALLEVAAQQDGFRISVMAEDNLGVLDHLYSFISLDSPLQPLTR